MIKINLLPTKAKQRQYTVVYQLVVGGVVLLIVLAISGVDWILLKHRESDAIARKAGLQKEIGELERLIGEVKQFETRKDELKRKLKVITDLNSNKVGPVHLLEELSVTIPKKVWVTSIREQTIPPAGHNVSLTGEAISDEVIAEFMTKLQESEYFSNVNLGEARAAGERLGVPIQSFTITAEMHLPAKVAAATTLPGQ